MIMPPEDYYQPYCEDCDGEICVKSDSLVQGYYQPPPTPRHQSAMVLTHAPPRAAEIPPNGAEAPPEAPEAPQKGVEAPTQGPEDPSQGAHVQPQGAQAPSQGAHAEFRGCLSDAPTTSKLPSALSMSRALQGSSASRQPSSESESTSSIDLRRACRRPSDFAPSDALTSSPTEFLTSSDVPTPSDVPNPSDLPTPTDPLPTGEPFGPTGEPDASSVASSPGEAWLRTGDLGRYDRKGRITIHGRVMDRIKFAGVTLMPHELEETLRKMRFVKEVCVVPIPCNVTPTAAVVLSKSWSKREATAAKRIHHLIRREEISPLAGGIVFCQSLPRSEDRRVLRHQLRHIQLPGLPTASKRKS